MAKNEAARIRMHDSTEDNILKLLANWSRYHRVLDLSQ